MSITATQENWSNNLALPALNTRTLITLLVSGAFAILAFDLFGQTISPLLKDIIPTLGAKLAPVPLANQSLGVITGLGTKFISQNGIRHCLRYRTLGVCTLCNGTPRSRKSCIPRLVRYYMGRILGTHRVWLGRCWLCLVAPRKINKKTSF